jgi:hypothetical protein
MDFSFSIGDLESIAKRIYREVDITTFVPVESASIPLLDFK